MPTPQELYGKDDNFDHADDDNNVGSGKMSFEDVVNAVWPRR